MQQIPGVQRQHNPETEHDRLYSCSLWILLHNTAGYENGRLSWVDLMCSGSPFTSRQFTWGACRRQSSASGLPVEVSVTQSCPSLCNSCSWNPPGKKIGVGCHFLLQGTFPTRGLHARLLQFLHWPVDALLLSHRGSPYLQEDPCNTMRWIICRNFAGQKGVALYIKVLKGENLQHWLLYPNKIIIQKRRERKNFSDRQ